MPRNISRAMRTALAALAAAGLSACSADRIPRIPGITPYKIDIQQGNYVSQEMVSQLKQGMSKDQVRLTLGTPLLTDIFHANRWDYVYWFEDAAGKREQRRLAVFFDDGKLARVDGDVVAAGPAQEGKGEDAGKPDAPGETKEAGK